MTEEEAADKLCALLNKIEKAGHQVSLFATMGQGWIEVGPVVEVHSPPSDDEPWEVRGL